LHLSPRGRLSNGPGRGGPIYRSVPARCMAGRWPCSSSHKLVRREIAEARMRTIREGVNRLDLAGLSCQPERSGRDMEKLRGLTEVQCHGYSSSRNSVPWVFPSLVGHNPFVSQSLPRDPDYKFGVISSVSDRS